MYADEFGTGEFEGGEDAHLDAAYEDKFADFGDDGIMWDEPSDNDYCWECEDSMEFCECDNHE